MIENIDPFIPHISILIENFIAPHFAPGLLRAFVGDYEMSDTHVGEPHLEQRSSLRKSKFVG
ncbi:hypothetical protein DDF62_01890 [Caulobacter radicis]|nr:hypothetical protein DDF62_01890 [Caulobacter radicis]